jgi:hypothetical protein
MVQTANFIVRSSGKKTGSFYIDYSGSYTLADLSKIAGVKQNVLEAIYLKNNATYDDSLDIYYFPAEEYAHKTIQGMLSRIAPANIGKCVYLSDAEIEFIRQALINEGTATVKFSNKIKDEIFKKLNEA